MTIIEKKAIKLFNTKYGISKESRYRKVCEEFKELTEAFNYYVNDPNKHTEEHLIDEISDVYTTVTHLASCFGLNHERLLQIAIDKIHERENNPEYKHKWTNILEDKFIKPDDIPEELIDG